jgi:hypothetical protein
MFTETPAEKSLRHKDETHRGRDAQAQKQVYAETHVKKQGM